MPSKIEKFGRAAGRVRNVRPEDIIVVPGKNFRDTSTPEAQAHIEWLKQSIMESGCINPVSVRVVDGKMYLEAGECRTLAAQALRKEGWNGYIKVEEVTSNDEIKNLRREVLDNGGLAPTILDIGRVVQRLIDYGQTLEEAATCIPPSVTKDPAAALRIARQALDLAEAPVAVKEVVRDGIDGVKVSPARAISEAKKNPLMAVDHLRKGAKEAKEKGQKVLRREKGEGEATRAKKVKESAEERLRIIGDNRADEILTAPDGQYGPALVGSARAWNQLRGR